MIADRNARTSARKPLTAGLALTLLALGPAIPACAEGALALGLPRDIVRQGVAAGYAVNHPDAQAARAQALKECREFAMEPKATTRLCKIVSTFRDQCISIAMDPQVGTPGFGWAIAKTKDLAEKDALSRCVATAGPSRDKFCKVDVTKCDGGQ
ncbi:MAG: DUF4189 domain-containing protein [Pseudorhodoplanes sp.]|nr:hypothetical protein [Pseudorhodoplanes sp.]MBW7948169.1 DUF4189 domain-containing protein [Pseudorhodoplanes sp.]